MSMPAGRLSNANVYERLGIRTIVNASGPSTRLSGGIMRPEVAAAMAEASQWCVDLAELQGRASEILAEATLKRPLERPHSWHGKRGQHSEHLGYMLAEMQYLQRLYPGARW